MEMEAPRKDGMDMHIIIIIDRPYMASARKPRKGKRVVVNGTASDSGKLFAQVVGR